MRNVITATVLGAALAAGLYFTAVDANPRFDDTGILAGLIVLTAGALSAVRPRAALIVGMLVGLPIPVVELIRSDFERWAALAALGLALAGAFAGAYIGIIVRRTAQQAT